MLKKAFSELLFKYTATQGFSSPPHGACVRPLTRTAPRRTPPAKTHRHAKRSRHGRHPARHIGGLVSPHLRRVLGAALIAVPSCSADGVLVEITHGKQVLGTKTAPVRKLYAHNGVLYTIHSDKVTAWRHTAASIATISDTDAKPFFQGPFANSIRILTTPLSAPLAHDRSPSASPALPAGEGK